MKGFLLEDICSMGLTVGGFLCSMHRYIVANEGMDFGVYSPLCPKSCRFTLFDI